MHDLDPYSLDLFGGSIQVTSNTIMSRSDEGVLYRAGTGFDEK